MPLLHECALDVIARHRATGDPLDRVAGTVGRARRLGPRERAALGDLVFGWARHRQAGERAIAAALARARGRAPPMRERDLCLLLLAQRAAGAEPDARARARLPDALTALLDLHADGGSFDGVIGLPDWLAARLAAQRQDLPELLAALAQPAPLGLALERSQLAVDDAVAALRALGADAAPSPLVAGAVRVVGRARLAKLPRAIGAALWPMDEGSQVIARTVDARRGERVLDLCAGAGTKTRLLLQTGAHVVAADLGAERLARAPAAAARVVMDGTSGGLRARSFDKVLLDAPCSGTGTLRRAPDLAHRLREQELPALVDAQRRLLTAAIALARPGGLVVYATCSLLHEENEAVVQRALTDTAGLARVPLRSLWGEDVRLDDEGKGELRLLPHLHGCDGFYLAALRAA